MKDDLMNSVRVGLLGKKLLPYEDGQHIISEEILANKPSMIARFGSTEIKAVLYPQMSLAKKVFEKRVINNMHILSGFFPPDKKSIEKFSELMFEDIKSLDILGSWRVEELFLTKKMQNAKLVPLKCLEPYYFENPWSRVLKGKDVLVIHPFTETIEQQYHNKRKLLYKDPAVLPQFNSLQTIKAVQTIAGNSSSGFSTWFDALDYMKEEIEKKNFEIAIIGCGAYGFPLAAHIKRMGKKAVHLGGPTQMLFGIKGKRWIESDSFKSIINEHFVYPLDADIPPNASKVENACYWK